MTSPSARPVADGPMALCAVPSRTPRRPLPQPGVGVDGQAEHRGERGGGLLRAAQVAGVDRADRAVAELRRGLGRLAQPALGQLRLVVVALGETRDVPGGLAMPDEPEAGSAVSSTGEGHAR